MNLQSNPFNIAVFTCACTTFWGATRLSEIVCLLKVMEPSHYVTQSFNLSLGPSAQDLTHPSSLNLHLPWTKTTKTLGANLHLSEWNDGSADISATKALTWHLRLSSQVCSAVCIPIPLH